MKRRESEDIWAVMGQRERRPMRRWVREVLAWSLAAVGAFLAGVLAADYLTVRW